MIDNMDEQPPSADLSVSDLDDLQIALSALEQVSNKLDNEFMARVRFTSGDRVSADEVKDAFNEFLYSRNSFWRARGAEEQTDGSYMVMCSPGDVMDVLYAGV